MNAVPERLAFSKMHGAGNDFVLLDRRGRAPLAAGRIRELADRHRGIGFDQLLTIEAARSPQAAFAYGIWNTDGSPAGQCGNGARCVAAWARRQGLVEAARFWMDSPSGPVEARFRDDGIAIDMGRPRFEAEAVPFLGDPADATVLFEGRAWPFRVASMGNPHALLVVDAVATAPVAALGARLQDDPRFPDRCNVGFAERVSRTQIRLRVFERGVGETLACGSGACAAAALLIRAGQLEREVAVDLPGGRLHVRWPDDDASIEMRGPATFVFEGVLDP